MTWPFMHMNGHVVCRLPNQLMRSYDAATDLCETVAFCAVGFIRRSLVGIPGTSCFHTYVRALAIGLAALQLAAFDRVTVIRPYRTAVCKSRIGYDAVVGIIRCDMVIESL